MTKKKSSSAAIPLWNILKPDILGKLSLMLLRGRAGNLPPEMLVKFHERANKSPTFILVLDSKPARWKTLVTTAPTGYCWFFFFSCLNNANKPPLSQSSTLALCRMQNWMVKMGSQGSDSAKQRESLPHSTFVPTTVFGLCDRRVSCALTPSSSVGGFICCWQGFSLAAADWLSLSPHITVHLAL